MSETHFVSYDPDAVWDQMMDVYISAGGDVLYGGDEKEILLRSALAVLVGVLAEVDNALRMATLRYAEGDYLKLLGESRFVPYIEAKKATGRIAVTFAQTGVGCTLAAGTLFTADGSKFFETTDAITNAGAAATIQVNVQCTEAGETGNNLGTGTPLTMVRPVPDVTGASVVTGTSGGAAEEDMEAYRERIRIGGMRGLTTGPAQQYAAAAMAASGDVLDATATNGGAGVVYVNVILKSTADAVSAIAAVTSALSPSDARPLTDSVTVRQATAKAYTINVGYQLQTSAVNAGLADLQAAANAYQKWQDETIGRDFDPYRLMAALYQAGASRVEFQTGSTFDDGTLEYTAVDENTRCLGTINLAVIE